jgi:hypothetical protein
VAVHPFKDLPVAITPGVGIAAVPMRGPVEDVLCARAGVTLADLPAGARVGTSSLRRIAQLRAAPGPDYGAARRRPVGASSAASWTRSCWRGPGSSAWG